MEILIVEDERESANGLKSILENVDPEHRILLAENGRYALEQLRAHGPFDLIFADVQMPVMTGLDFLKEVKAYLPNQKVVIISGYSNFDYAQRALRLGAMDYILKPFSRQEIVNLLKYIEALPGSNADRRSGQLLPDHVQTALKRWIRDPIRFSDYIRQLWPRAVEGLLVGFHALDEGLDAHAHASAKTPIMAEITRALSEATGGQNCAVFSHPFAESEILCACFIERGSDAARRPVAGLMNLLNDIQAQFGLTYFAAVSDPQNDLAGEAHIAYRQTESLMQYSFYTEGPSWIDSTFLRARNPVGEEESLVGSLSQRVEQGDTQGVRTLLEDYSDRIAQPPWIAPFHVLSTLQSAAFVSLGHLQKKLHQAELEALSLRAQQLFKRPGRLRTFFNEYAVLMVEIAALTARWNTNRHALIIERAIQYIREHYTDQDMTVETVAETFYFSAGHFSAIFRRQTGLTFTQYLNTVRIEGARERLRQPDETIQQIATAVGYADPHYFSRVFRNLVGLSPMEFRKQLSMQVE